MKIRPGRKALVVAIELVIALVFVIGADWAGDRFHGLFHSYYADLALPFGFYFLLTLLEESQPLLRPWYAKALAVFLLTSTSEVLQYFGIYALARVFDPLDFVMYGSGALLGALVDGQLISRYYPEFHAASL